MAFDGRRIEGRGVDLRSMYRSTSQENDWVHFSRKTGLVKSYFRHEFPTIYNCYEVMED